MVIKQNNAITKSTESNFRSSFKVFCFVKNKTKTIRKNLHRGCSMSARYTSVLPTC